MLRLSNIVREFYAQQILSLLLSCSWLTVQSEAQTNPPPADVWLSNFVQFPSVVDTNRIRLSGFEKLRAEVNAGRLKVLWSPPQLNTNVSVVAQASEDEPGHWPVRDWHSYPMSLRGTNWEASVPVCDVDVPVVYFVEMRTASSNNVSPMRLCRPRAAGLEEPSRVFWPFLEGFETGTDGWSSLASAPDSPSLKTDPTSKNGLAALRVSLPAGKRSVTVATTRVRGWQILQNGATGLRLWLRMREGIGHARFTLFANAFATNQVVSVSSIEAKLNNRWQKVELPFTSFPTLPLANVDWFTIEFIGTGPRDFLIDDLQLLGPWKIELE
ncbi:MAG: hypothetical protein HY298_21865 [Verrucomicrobia bacterium]|nr:hypothetical protein [Verrucomicrobiota bacterium]